MDRRTMAVCLVLIAVLAATAVGCGDSSPADGAGTTVVTTGAQPSTDSTAPPSEDSTPPTAETAGDGGQGGSSAGVDPSTLLTDEDAAAYFGVPAKHEGPAAVGPFANVTYSPADGSGQLIIITMLGSDTLETFENQVKVENEAFGEEPQPIEGIGEKAYFTISTVRFFKNGASYQVTASNPPNGEDFMTALIPLAQKMASRVP